jgi:hypothetical protein
LGQPRTAGRIDQQYPLQLRIAADFQEDANAALERLHGVGERGDFPTSLACTSRITASTTALNRLSFGAAQLAQANDPSRTS